MENQELGSEGEGIALELRDPDCSPFPSLVIGPRGPLLRHRMKMIKQVLGIGKKQC